MGHGSWVAPLQHPKLGHPRSATLEHVSTTSRHGSQGGLHWSPCIINRRVPHCYRPPEVKGQVTGVSLTFCVSGSISQFHAPVAVHTDTTIRITVETQEKTLAYAHTHKHMNTHTHFPLPHHTLTLAVNTAITLQVYSTTTALTGNSHLSFPNQSLSGQR